MLSREEVGLELGRRARGVADLADAFTLPASFEATLDVVHDRQFDRGGFMPGAPHLLASQDSGVLRFCLSLGSRLPVCLAS